MKTVTFRFDEFDEAIDEAIEDDIKEADGGGLFLLFIFHSNGGMKVETEFILVWQAMNRVLSLTLCNLQFLILHFWAHTK